MISYEIQNEVGDPMSTNNTAFRSHSIDANVRAELEAALTRFFSTFDPKVQQVAAATETAGQAAHKGGLLAAGTSAAEASCAFFRRKEAEQHMNDFRSDESFSVSIH